MRVACWTEAGACLADCLPSNKKGTGVLQDEIHPVPFPFLTPASRRGLYLFSRSSSAGCGWPCVFTQA